MLAIMAYAVAMAYLEAAGGGVQLEGGSTAHPRVCRGPRLRQEPRPRSLGHPCASPRRPGWSTIATCSSSGRPGWGKTFVACALAQAALRRGHRALYLRVPRLLDELVLARADGRLPRLLTAWGKIDVLALDDLALQPIAPARAADLLEVIEDRHGLRSTIVTSQLPVAHWHEALDDPTIADAILDRLVHNAYRIELHGDSLRRPEAVATGAADAALTLGAPTARKPTASDGPGRPLSVRDVSEHPSETPASAALTDVPDYPQNTERR